MKIPKIKKVLLEDGEKMITIFQKNFWAFVRVEGMTLINAQINGVSIDFQKRIQEMDSEDLKVSDLQRPFNLSLETTDGNLVFQEIDVKWNATYTDAS